MILYLFDIDGTLLHARASGRVAFDAIFQELHALADASVGVSYGGKTDGAILDEIFRARLDRSPTPEEVDGFLGAYIPRLEALLAAQGVEVLAGVVESLAYLREQTNVALGVATGNIKAGARAKLASGNLESWFAFGGYGCDSTVRAELVARAIERGRELLPATEVIVVGDTIHDIAAARACGATVVAVATGSDSAEALRDADAVLLSMTELPAWHEQRYGSASSR